MLHHTLPLSERDFAVLRATGFPLAADFEIAAPCFHDVVSTVLRVMASPAARLVEAAAFALCYATAQEDASSFQLPSEPSTLRRLGFVLETLAKEAGLPARQREHLAGWLALVEAKLSGFLRTSQEPLGLSSMTTPGQMRRLQTEASPQNNKWGVYGSFEIRRGLLSS